MFNILDELAEGEFWTNLITLVKDSITEMWRFATSFIGDFQGYFDVLPPELSDLVAGFYSLALAIALTKIFASYI